MRYTNPCLLYVTYLLTERRRQSENVKNERQVQIEENVQKVKRECAMDVLLARRTKMRKTRDKSTPASEARIIKAVRLGRRPPRWHCDGVGGDCFYPWPAAIRAPGRDALGIYRAATIRAK